MAMAVTATDLRIGMIVVTADGTRLGTIQAIGEREVSVDVRFGPDFAVPFTDLEAVVGELVILNVPLGQLVHHARPARG
jgi:hypothetical protein